MCMQQPCCQAAFWPLRHSDCPQLGTLGSETVLASVHAVYPARHACHCHHADNLFMLCCHFVKLISWSATRITQGRVDIPALLALAQHVHMVMRCTKLDMRATHLEMCRQLCSTIAGCHCCGYLQVPPHLVLNSSLLCWLAGRRPAMSLDCKPGHGCLLCYCRCCLVMQVPQHLGSASSAVLDGFLADDDVLQLVPVTLLEHAATQAGPSWGLDR